MMILGFCFDLFFSFSSLFFKHLFNKEIVWSFPLKPYKQLILIFIKEIIKEYTSKSIKRLSQLTMCLIVLILYTINSLI